MSKRNTTYVWVVDNDGPYDIIGYVAIFSTREKAEAFIIRARRQNEYDSQYYKIRKERLR